MIIGKHLINGDWVQADETFESQPLNGNKNSFAKGRVQDIEASVEAAQETFLEYSNSSREKRAEFLNTIADEIEKRGEELSKIGNEETGLPLARLEGEKGRTTMQLRTFATHILAKDYLDIRFDEALPNRKPFARPDMYLMQRSLGVVAVFGASNFPLAFSTAGGDTASALAAGCPVVVKSHSAHPGTSEIVAQAILEAIKKCNLNTGIFSLIQGGNRKVGEALVTHKDIKAVGFTGSLSGGRALFNLCATREEPIPFFGELGSVNPMFFLEHSLKEDTSTLAKGWADSLTMGAGQFCTNPGISIVLEGKAANTFIEETKKALSKIPSQVMLSDGIAQAYRDGQKRVSSYMGVQEILKTSCDLRTASPYLYTTTAKQWLQNDDLGEEVFGPLGIIVIAKDFNEMKELANNLKGQLTCTIHLKDEDEKEGKELLPILETKAGRILANGFPTGVEVNDTMVHGGPFPASTNFGATSVGTMAIRRFLRPVCYQNLPKSLLPEDLQ